MYYYRFFIFTLKNGNIGVSQGTTLHIITALPRPYIDDSSEECKLLKLLSQKIEALKDQHFLQIRITEYKEISERIFKNRKTKIMINFEEWL